MARKLLKIYRTLRITPKKLLTTLLLISLSPFLSVYFHLLSSSHWMRHSHISCDGQGKKRSPRCGGRMRTGRLQSSGGLARDIRDKGDKWTTRLICRSQRHCHVASTANKSINNKIGNQTSHPHCHRGAIKVKGGNSKRTNAPKSPHGGSVLVSESGNTHMVCVCERERGGCTCMPKTVVFPWRWVAGRIADNRILTSCFSLSLSFFFLSLWVCLLQLDHISFIPLWQQGDWTMSGSQCLQYREAKRPCSPRTIW